MRARLSLFRTLRVLLILPLVAGCGLPAMLGHFEPPVVSVNATKVESVSLTTAVIQLTLMVRNPNAFELTTRTVRYRLSVSDHVLADGTATNRLTLSAHTSSAVNLRIEVSFNALRDAAPDAVMVGEIPYELDGVLVVGSFLSQEEVPFSAASVLRLNLPLELARAPRLPSPREPGTRTLVSHQ